MRWEPSRLPVDLRIEGIQHAYAVARAGERLCRVRAYESGSAVAAESARGMLLRSAMAGLRGSPPWVRANKRVRGDGAIHITLRDDPPHNPFLEEG